MYAHCYRELTIHNGASRSRCWLECIEGRCWCCQCRHQTKKHWTWLAWRSEVILAEFPWWRWTSNFSQPSQPMPSQPQTHWVHCNNLLLMLKVIQRIFLVVWNSLCQTHAKENSSANLPTAKHRLLTVIRLIGNSIPTYQGAKLTARGLKLPQPTRNPSATKSAISQKDKTTSRLWVDPNDKGSVIQVKLQLPSFVLPISRQPPNWEHRPKLMGLIEPARLPLLSCMVKHRVKPNNDGYMSSLVALVLKWKLPAVPLGESLLDLPTCSAKKVGIPKGDQDIMRLRINLPFCFSEYSWKQCQVKPANIISGRQRPPRRADWNLWMAHASIPTMEWLCWSRHKFLENWPQKLLKVSRNFLETTVCFLNLWQKTAQTLWSIGLLKTRANPMMSTWHAFVPWNTPIDWHTADKARVV